MTFLSIQTYCQELHALINTEMTFLQRKRLSVTTPRSSPNLCIVIRDRFTIFPRFVYYNYHCHCEQCKLLWYYSARHCDRNVRSDN